MQNQTVHVVTIEHLWNLDDCQRSYLPELNTVFGVYDSKGKATEAVHNYFEGREKCEAIFLNSDIPEEVAYHGLCFDTAFKYTDATYGGYVIYCVTYTPCTIE